MKRGPGGVVPVVVTVSGGAVDLVKKPGGVSVHVVDFDIVDKQDKDLCTCNILNATEEGEKRKPHYHVVFNRHTDGPMRYYVPSKKRK